MTRPLNKLPANAAKSLKGAGRHSDGGGLYLSVSNDGRHVRRRWVFMYSRGGKQTEIGLGPAPEVSLADARAAAERARAAIKVGQDPRLANKAVAAIPTFGAQAEDYIAAHASSFRNEKHIDQWRMTMSVQRDEAGELLATGYCLSLRDLPVDQVGTEQVLGVLQPIWQTKPETASRVRGRIERVLDAAKAAGHRTGENPARWRGHLQTLLARRQKLTRGHHAAMPYGEIPAFALRLGDLSSNSAKALRFLLLGASRSGEVLGACWNEIDAAVWTVPAKRMKAGRLHRVPLTEPMLDILKDMAAQRPEDDIAGNAPIFPGVKGHLSIMSLTMVLRRMGLGHFTVHGFRSSFRDWAAEETDHARETAEAALAHIIGDQTERAYRRGDALEKRRALMSDWALHVQSKSETAASNT